MPSPTYSGEPPPSELRALLNLALPLTLGQWAQMAMHTIDTAMVGRLGVEAVAASSLGNVATAPFFMALGGLGAALPPLMARMVAANDRAAADRLLRQAWACALVLTIATAAGFMFVVQWLPGNGQPASVVSTAQAYGSILIWSLIPAMLVQNLRGLAEAHNHPWLPLGNIVLGLFVNVGCNRVLIYGLGPVPALGVPGAAIGTGIARTVMLAHFVAVVWRRPELRPAAGWLTRAPWLWSDLQPYLRLGGLTAASIVLVVGSGVVMTFGVARLGPEALAAHEIARQVWMLCYVIPIGWSTAAALRTAWWLGRGDIGALRRNVRLTFLVGGGGGFAIAVIVALLSPVLPTFFLGQAGGADAAAVAALASRLLPITALLLACEGVLLTAVGVCRGLAYMGPVAVIYLLSYWCFGLGAARWLGASERWGLPGVWLGMGIGVFGGACWLSVVTVRRIRRTARAAIAPVVTTTAAPAETASTRPA